MAENLWVLREQKKLSVAALANRAGLPISLLMEYESGQRSIDPRHLGRLARALYVEESDIRMQSDPRSGTAALERQVRSESIPRQPAPAAPDETAPAPRQDRERSPRTRSGQKAPPLPARPSQVAHLQALLIRLARTPASVEAQFGRPIADLDRVAMSAVLKSLQDEARKNTAERHRAYLPEGVDQYETRYLQDAADAGAVLRFVLFDGSSVTGKVIGFGPYSINVKQADESELTLNKLALVYYAKEPRA